MASAHHAPPQRYALPPPNAHNDFRLPSLKDLNFQYRPPPPSQDSSPTPQLDPVPTQEHSPRHGPAAWSRPNPTSSVPAPMPHPHHHQHQHSPSLQPAHDPQTPKPIEYPSKHDNNGGYLTPGVPMSAQITPVPVVNIGPGTRGDDMTHPHNSLKRAHSASTVNVPRDSRPTHPPYPPQYASYASPQPPPPPPFQPGPPVHEQIHHTGAAPPSHPGYGYPQYMQPRPHMHPQHPHPHAHPHAHLQQHQSASNPYPPAPPPQDPWEHHQHHQQQQHQQHQQQQQPLQQHQHQHQQPQQQQQQQPLQQHPLHQQQLFSRTTALIPTNIDTRATTLSTNDTEKTSARDSTVSEIIKHCTAIYTFASRYAQMQVGMPHVQPLTAELTEMAHRASQVVRLVEELRRITQPEADRLKVDSTTGLNSADDHRPPKRPWEDLSRDGAEGGTHPDHNTGTGDKQQTTAEQDMEIIRTKRATSAAGGTAASGQPKSKYRKRSRATPPGKCHSCNIRETPEWRRGPDGARTLCNACGLHYAKLMRKRDKVLGPAAADAPRIDMDTLRASARAADLAEKTHTRPSKHSASRSESQQGNEATSPPLSGKQLPQQHHQGSFQLVPVIPSGSNAPPSGSDMGNRQAMQAANNASIPVPPPPWAASASSAGRGYAPDQLQHQSFIRTSQHGTSNSTSPR